MIDLAKTFLAYDRSLRDTCKLVKYRELYRKSGRLKRAIYIRLYYRIMRKYGSDISMFAQIGEDLCLPHGMNGIFISGGASVGNSCTIFQQVTIGSNTLVDAKRERRGAPKIGDNVYIGAGAKIIGNVSVGDNCRIGANAIVVTDIPSNTVVVMNKPRLICRENLDNKFVPLAGNRI